MAEDPAYTRLKLKLGINGDELRAEIAACHVLLARGLTIPQARIDRMTRVRETISQIREELRGYAS